MDKMTPAPGTDVPRVIWPLHLLKSNSEMGPAGCTHAQDQEVGSLLEKGKGFLRDSISHHT